MRKVFETAVILIGTLGWWGFVYPELSLTWETCQEEEIPEGKTAPEDLAETFRQDDPKGLMGVFAGESGNVCIKSRIIEYLYEEKEKGFGK